MATERCEIDLQSDKIKKHLLGRYQNIGIDVYETEPPLPAAHALLAAPKAWGNARVVLSAKKKGAEVLAPIDAATAQLQLIFSLLLTISLFVASVI